MLLVPAKRSRAVRASVSGSGGHATGASGVCRGGGTHGTMDGVAILKHEVWICGDGLPGCWPARPGLPRHALTREPSDPNRPHPRPKR